MFFFLIKTNINTPEGGKYPKTTRAGKATKKKKQKGSLEECCESLIVGTADGREEREEKKRSEILADENRNFFGEKAKLPGEFFGNRGKSENASLSQGDRRPV